MCRKSGVCGSPISLLHVIRKQQLTSNKCGDDSPKDLADYGRQDFCGINKFNPLMSTVAIWIQL